MTANDNRYRWIMTVVLAVVLNTWVMNYDTHQLWLVILGMYLAVILVTYVRQKLAVRRMVRALRRLDPVFRQAVVRSIDPPVVAQYYDERLRAEGDADIAGMVERYPFAPSDKRDQTWRYWTTIAIAGVALASPFVWPRMPSWERDVAFGVALVCVAALALIRRRIRHLDTILEVSPFGLTELDPDGTRRTLRFDQPLIIRFIRWRTRIELRPAAGRRGDRIELNLDRIGFNRLITRVFVWGGFARRANEASASEAPTSEASASEAPTSEAATTEAKEAAAPKRIQIPVPWQIPTISQWRQRQVAAALWPLLLVLVFVPPLVRWIKGFDAQPTPLVIARPLPADTRGGNALVLDSAIAAATAFNYPGEFLALPRGDTIWVRLAGRADSATVLEVTFPDHKERIWVVRKTHRLIRRVILQA